MIFKEITRRVKLNGERVYIPEIGVIYREELPKSSRLSESDDEDTRRFKVKLSAKAYKLKADMRKE